MPNVEQWSLELFPALNPKTNMDSMWRGGRVPVYVDPTHENKVWVIILEPWNFESWSGST